MTGCVPLFVALCGGSAGAQTTQPAQSTLRQAAAGKLLVGAAVMAHALNDERVARIVAEQFNSLTPENECKPASLQPEPGRFTFGPADRLVEFAERNKMAFIGHTLVWHQQAPGWLYRGSDGKPLSRERALKNMKEHVTTVVSRYRGKVVGWDVVNEAISDRQGEYLRQTPALLAIGEDYIDKAFEFAHAADPGAELYYNDYGIERPDKRMKTLKLIRRLKQKGIPIHGVGIQGHWDLAQADLKTIEDAIVAFGKEGMKVMFTELDIDVLPRRQRGVADISATQAGGANPYRDGIPDKVLRQQAQRYADLFRLFVKHKDVVTRATVWGVEDGQSWLNHFPVRGRTNYPLLFDRKFQPKPALQSVIDVLLRH